MTKQLSPLSTPPIWVIHKMWAGESAARALFFTRDQGVLWAKYHGGWSPKKQALLQAFTPLWVDFKQRHTWYYVQNLEITGMAFDFRATQLFSALYVNELIYHGLCPHDPHPHVYDAYVTTLQQMSLTDTQLDLERVLRRFEWLILATMGYAISFTHEAEQQLPILATQSYRFQAGQGFLVADSGILGSDLLALSQDDLSEPHVLKTAKYIMRQALEHALGNKKIKSRDLFKTFAS
jgi:DNA repair protein RecO (recombination protein O)